MRGDFQVGAWLVKPSLNVIFRNGTNVHLEPKVMEVLVCLAAHAGETVPKEQLVQVVWPDTFVSDDGLKRCISDLRRVFEDDAREPRIIETIPKRGYRLLAPVEQINLTKEPLAFAPVLTSNEVARGQAVPIKRSRWWLGAMATAGVVVIAAVLQIALRLDRSARAGGTPAIRSLAVLPLRNLSADPSQEYFSEGMTDALITDLAQIGSVKVISRTSSMQYKQSGKSLPEIARELNVDAIVEGTVQRSGNRVRITAQLIHGPSDKHLWASSYERDLSDVFALEQEVTLDIANQVIGRITSQNRSLPVEPRPVNIQALEAYLQGNFHLRMSAGRRDVELRKAASYFQNAIDADPALVPAYIGMSEAHEHLFWPSREDFAIMRASAENAVELAPTSSETHERIAKVKFEEWDWAGAEAEFRRAIELSPNNAGAQDGLGDTLDVQGQLDEGWKHEEIAQELDPNEDHLTWALFRRGQYDRAISLAQRVSESHPEDAVILWQLSESYARKGLYKQWADEWGKSLVLAGFPATAARLRRAFATSGYLGALRQTAHDGERAVAEKRAYFPGLLAEAYAQLGDKDRAFYWLQQGCEHRFQAMSDPLLQWTKVDLGFASLHSDARFKDVMRCMGLPP